MVHGKPLFNIRHWSFVTMTLKIGGIFIIFVVTPIQVSSMAVEFNPNTDSYDLDIDSMDGIYCHAYNTKRLNGTFTWHCDQKEISSHVSKGLDDGTQESFLRIDEDTKVCDQCFETLRCTFLKDDGDTKTDNLTLLQRPNENEFMAKVELRGTLLDIEVDFKTKYVLSEKCNTEIKRENGSTVNHTVKNEQCTKTLNFELDENDWSTNLQVDIVCPSYWKVTKHVTWTELGLPKLSYKQDSSKTNDEAGATLTFFECGTFFEANITAESQDGYFEKFHWAWSLDTPDELSRPSCKQELPLNVTKKPEIDFVIDLQWKKEGLDEWHQKSLKMKLVEDKMRDHASTLSFNVWTILAIFIALVALVIVSLMGWRLIKSRQCNQNVPANQPEEETLKGYRDVEQRSEGE